MLNNCWTNVFCSLGVTNLAPLVSCAVCRQLDQGSCARIAMSSPLSYRGSMMDFQRTCGASLSQSLFILGIWQGDCVKLSLYRVLVEISISISVYCMYINIYIYTHIFTFLFTVYIYMYICRYKYTYTYTVSSISIVLKHIIYSYWFVCGHGQRGENLTFSRFKARI